MSRNAASRSGAWIAAVSLLITAGCATPTTLQPDDKQLLQRAMDAAGEVDGAVKRAEAAADRAEAAAGRAESAADRAESAANRAEQAANKAAKALELQQRK